MNERHVNRQQLGLVPFLMLGAAASLFMAPASQAQNAQTPANVGTQVPDPSTATSGDAVGQPVQTNPQLAPVAPPRVYPRLDAAQLDQLVAFLKTAPEHGMPAVTIPALSPGADESLDAQRALVDAALDLARSIHSGRLAPDQFEEDWALQPLPFDPFPGFASAVAAGALTVWLNDLPPPYAGYDALKAGLASYRRIAANGGWPVIPAGGDMRAGATGVRVQKLRQRLAVEDPAVAATGGFDPALADAVRRAQRRFGLAPTGAVAAQTLAALNVSAADRARQIAANMERWRWMPRELPTHRVQVNIAAAVLTVFEGDQPIASMRAVTGSPDHPTPMLQSVIKSIVVNPPWNVPDSIAQREIWPKVRANPGYLRSHSFKVITNPDGTKRLQQAAGTSSALGRLKFDFANPFAVYLHDTPTKSTFSTYSRLESHGCIRLERPRDLATLMLRDKPEWQSPETISAAINTGKTERVVLATPVSVYLLYWTAYGSNSGAMNFRADPYGWDRALAAKIQAPRKQLLGTTAVAQATTRPGGANPAIGTR